MRLHTRATVQAETPLKLSFKENMPQSTIMIKLDKTDDELLNEMNSGCATRIRKAIKKGTKAPVAAGKIHSDIQRGFIRAETIGYEELVEIGGNMSAARDKGLIRSEGKEYIVQDGDVILFRFNV